MKRLVTLLAAAAAVVHAADEPLPEILRALENMGSASGARPSEDSRQIVFVTTLFGSRQAAVMPLEGGYPLQVTAEPGGASVRGGRRPIRTHSARAPGATGSGGHCLSTTKAGPPRGWIQFRAT